MIVKKLLTLSYWKLNSKVFNETFSYDLKFNATFRGINELPKSILKSREIKYIKYYRKAQANIGTVWYRLFYYPRLVNYSLWTGIGLYNNLNIPKGLIIGHVGTIVISPDVKFGGNLLLSHGVTIGRENRGSNSGVPSIGKNVCIKCNSTIVGNITIGDDVLISPNSFVNFDVPSHSVVVANSAEIKYNANATEGYIGHVEK